MGASSVVYEATFAPLNAVVAVKVIDCDRLSTNAIDRVRREIQLMSLSKHTNVLRVRGTWLDGSKLYIAERFMASGSMHDIVRAVIARFIRLPAARRVPRDVAIAQLSAHTRIAVLRLCGWFRRGDLCGHTVCLCSVSEADRESAQVIEGLAYMHQNDWLHRDVR